MIRTVFLALLLFAAGCRDADEASMPPPSFEPIAERPRVALVLGSGGPRGFAHIGAIKALEEMGVVPDLIVGSSVGALVATLQGAGMDGNRLEQLALDLDLLEFFELRQVVGKLPTAAPIGHFVNEAIGGRPLETLRPRVAVVATRRQDGRLVVFNRGDAGLAVRASVASPGDYAPVSFGGETYVDGDVASPVPIRAARELGARVVIAVDVSAHVETTPPGVPRAWVEKDARRARQVRLEAPAADVLLHPDIGYYAGHTAGYRRRVIDVAERYTRERRAEILAAVERAQLQPAPRAVGMPR